MTTLDGDRLRFVLSAERVGSTSIREYLKAVYPVKSMRGDKRTDRLYADIRGRFGERSPLANGYRTRAYFLREQSVLHGLLNADASTVVDIACGSGLMLRLLVDGRRVVFGIDFNADACQAANSNGFPVVRAA